jgi:transcriptional regulator with XRE-family HTH domain
MPKTSFGKKLQQIRKSKNLTQAALAEKADVNEKHISKIETGVYFPTYSTLSKVLQALDLNIEDVGLDLAQVHSSDNPYYIKSLQILNSAKNEQEYEYYYGILNQAKKGLEVITAK